MEDGELFEIIIREVRLFETIGFNGNNKQAEVKVILKTVEGSMIVWHENSAHSFSSYDRSQVLTASLTFAQKLSKLTGYPVIKKVR